LELSAISRQRSATVYRLLTLDPRLTVSTLTLKNPHSVLAAIRARPQDVLDVRVAAGAGDAWRAVTDAATTAGVRVRPAAPTSGGKKPMRVEPAGRTGGSEAVVREPAALGLRDLFAPASGSGPDNPSSTGSTAQRSPWGLWLALDQIQDPHNLGAIFRTAAFFGVRGIVLTRHQSAPITAAVVDVATGGVESVPFAIESNLRRSLEVAKESNLWVLGTSEHSARPVWEVPRDRHWLVVLGNEESGLRRLTAETCDELCGVEPAGPLGSLNVSVATGVLLAALTRPIS
jgi:23S rRNA (guanosine2251-2'-O)-methyltransferase